MAASSPDRAIGTCPICTSTAAAAHVVARERMFGMPGTFTYAACARCGSLYHDESIDVAAYYPPAYYAFADARPGRLRHLAAQLLRRRLYANWMRLLAKLDLRISRSAAILDAGCGSGELLTALAERGYTDLLGADPFLERAPHRGAVRIVTTAIESLDGMWDLIMFNHSLEHMPSPRTVIAAALARLRSSESALLIRLPIAGALFERYGADWVQLDAPRHRFVPTEHGLCRLIADLGGSVERVVYDATPFGYWASDHYRSGGTLTRILRSLPRTLAFELRGEVRYGRRVRALNRNGAGDQAAFVIRRLPPQAHRTSAPDPRA